MNTISAAYKNHQVKQTVDIKMNELYDSIGAWQMCGDVTHVGF